MSVRHPTSFRTPESPPSPGRSGVLSGLRTSALATAVSLYGVLHGGAAPSQERDERPDVLALSEEELPAHFRDIMRRMDADTFRERERATGEFHRDVRRLLNRVNPLPRELRDIVAAGTAEQLYRAGSVVADANERGLEREATLNLEGMHPVRDVVARWERHLGVRIPLAGELPANAPISLDRHDTYATTLAKICRTIGAVPADDGSLVPAPNPSTVVTASEKLLGIVSTGEDGVKTMRVLYEPGRGTILWSTLNPEDGNGWYQGTPVLRLEPADRAPAVIHAELAYAPVTASIRIGSLRDVDFQRITVSGIALPDRYRTTVDLSRNDCTEHTRTPRGMETRPIFASGRYEPVDAHGNCLPIIDRAIAPHMVSRAGGEDPPPAPDGTIERPDPKYIPDPHGRTIVTIETAKPPAAVRASVWSKYKNEELRLPPFDAPDPEPAAQTVTSTD